MRWLGVLGLCGACTGPGPAPGVALVLDIPNGPLDPIGFTSVEVTLYAPSGVVSRSASLGPEGTFDLGRIDPSPGVSVEATLRNDTGAAVGYGRTAIPAAFAGGAEIVVPVRRPIAYLAGRVSRDQGTGLATELHWTQAPATFSDLSVGTSLDGTTQIGTEVVMMIAAGPDLYQIAQATSDPDGALIGPARLLPVSTADHQIGPPLAAQLTGGVADGAGADDGSVLVIGTTAQLFAVDTAAGTARALASGSFARVAIVATAAGELAAIAIRNRGATTGPCSTAAELWWAPITGGDGGPARKVATGGFSDLATDRGRAYYVDACSGELGELTATTTRGLRTVAGKPTALAVSGGQAYIGLESQPATTSLVVASLEAADPPRLLWSETAQQVLNVVSLPEVRRQLDAASVQLAHLEVGAGGDYVALTTRAHYRGEPLPEVRFPEMIIDSEELRVFDAVTGGVVQRYRGWCDGVVFLEASDISGWSCASTAGLAEATSATYEHHLDSMTFQFGKK